MENTNYNKNLEHGYIYNKNIVYTFTTIIL